MSLLALFILLLTSGCSHLSPYYRADISPPPYDSPNFNEVQHRFILIGDAGECPKRNEAVFNTLREWIQQVPEKTTVIFLGDNIYRVGMPEKFDEDSAIAMWRLSFEIEMIREYGANGFFIPGNHDWADGKEDGMEQLLREQRHINELLPGSDNFLPRDGCPGPVAVDYDCVRVIVLDTQWWLHKHKKPSSTCPCTTKGEVLDKLMELLLGAGDREVMIVAHHPLASHGTAGGFYDWRDHIFPSIHLAEWLWIPTPVLGSLYPLLRANVFRADQSLHGTDYADMIQCLSEALSTGKPLIYASGHDHGLQVLEGGDAARYLLVSALGYGQKGTAVSHGNDTLFAHLHPGFMVVDFTQKCSVVLSVVEPEHPAVVFQKTLKENR